MNPCGGREFYNLIITYDYLMLDIRKKEKYEKQTVSSFENCKPKDIDNVESYAERSDNILVIAEEDDLDEIETTSPHKIHYLNGTFLFSL